MGCRHFDNYIGIGAIPTDIGELGSRTCNRVNAYSKCVVFPRLSARPDSYNTGFDVAQLPSGREKFRWVCLKSVTVKTTFNTDDILHMVELLKTFRQVDLKRVTVSFHSTYYGDFISIMANEAHSELCVELDRVLRQFPQHAMLFPTEEPSIHSASAPLYSRSWTTTPRADSVVHVNRPSEPCAPETIAFLSEIKLTNELTAHSRLEDSGCDHLY